MWCPPVREIGDQGREKAVRGGEQGKNERGLEGTRHEAGGGEDQLRFRQASRHGSDDGGVTEPQQAHQCPANQGQQGSGQQSRQAPGPDRYNNQRQGGDGKGAAIDVGHRPGQRVNRAQRSAEQSREKAGGNSAVQARGRPQARRHAEGQCDRQRHHRGGDTAGEIPSECLEVVIQWATQIHFLVLAT